MDRQLQLPTALAFPPLGVFKPVVRKQPKPGPHDDYLHIETVVMVIMKTLV